MANGAKPSHLTRGGRLESSYRAWEFQRPQLFGRSMPQSPMAGLSQVKSHTFMPNRGIQVTNTVVHISVIADDQEHTVDLPTTIYDGSLQKSLITESKALATKGRIVSTPLTSAGTEKIGAMLCDGSKPPPQNEPPQVHPIMFGKSGKPEKDDDRLRREAMKKRQVDKECEAQKQKFKDGLEKTKSQGQNSNRANTAGGHRPC